MQHDKTWVPLTFPTYTQRIYSIQSHSRLVLPPVPSSNCLHATILFSPPPNCVHYQVCQIPFDEHTMFLRDTTNAEWHLDCLLPPLTTMPTGTWKCPLCNPRLAILHQAATRHLRLPSPILDFDSDSDGFLKTTRYY